MIYVFEAVLMAISVAFAWIQSDMIKDDDSIEHGWWSVAFGIFVLGFSLMLYGLAWKKCLLFGAIQGLGHLPAFNFLLNSFRKDKAWNYVSTKTTSLLDKAQYWLFGSKAWIFWIVCGAAFIALQFFFI